MKVLFCTDGSEASFYAIRKTLPFLKPDYQLDIIYIEETGILTTYPTFPHQKEEGFPDRKNYAQDIVDKTRDLIESEGYKAGTATICQGHPAEIIIEHINENPYDLVSLGSHGKHGLRKWLGSISRKVVTKSHIPVLVARPPKEIENGSKFLNSKKEILVTTDGSASSYNAIKGMFNILNTDGATFEVLTIKVGMDDLPFEVRKDPEWVEIFHTRQKEIADENLNTAKKILEDYGFTAEKYLAIEGDPANVIIDYTDKHSKDLIVLGSHGKEGISDFLLGSVSKRVLDHATSPVLIVPTRKHHH